MSVSDTELKINIASVSENGSVNPVSQISMRTRRTKKVIELLKKKTMTAKELLEQTGIAKKNKKSLYRILKELDDLGLVKKRKEDGRWIWYEYAKSYTNGFMYEIALKHAKELLPGFTALLDTNPQTLLNYRTKGTTPKGPRYQLEKSDESSADARIKSYRFSEFLEEHLQTGYPNIHKDLVNFRKLSAKLEKLKQSEEAQILKKLQGKILGPDRMMIFNREKKPAKSWFRKLFPSVNLVKWDVPYVLGPFASEEEITSLIGTYDYEAIFYLKKEKKWYVKGPIYPRTFNGFNDFVETQKSITRTYQELAAKLLLLKMRIESGRPLLGDCRLCPRIIITASSST